MVTINLFCRGYTSSYNHTTVTCVDARLLTFLNTWYLLFLFYGNQHTARGSELAMTSAQRLVDADWAMEILSLANAKKKCSATTQAIAVQVLAESGRLREASALLKVTVLSFNPFLKSATRFLDSNNF